MPFLRWLLKAVLTLVLVLFIIATLTSIGTTLLNRAWLTIQGSDEGAPAPNTVLVKTPTVPASVLDAADVSNVTTVVEFAPLDEVDLK